MRAHFLKKYFKECKKTDRRNVGSAGFTLIELLVVISIIGVLSAVVMASLQAGRQKAYDAQIVSDMTQIRSALELYANDHGYTYPSISDLAVSSTSPAAAKTAAANLAAPTRALSNGAAAIFATKAYAAGRNQNCIYYDNLITKLSPYISALPKHPLDDGGDVCYKYFSSDSGDMAVVYGPSVMNKYSDGTNKQVGIAVGKTDIESLQSICSANLSSGSFVNGTASPFPLFSGGNDKCSGVVADDVIGVASGQGDVTFAYSCSIDGYSNQEDCERDRSYCSDGSYTDQSSCESNGVSSPGTCSGGPQYTDASSCTSAGYSDSGSCSNGYYTDQSSCEGAGYTTGGCSDSSYSDYYSCVNAGYYSSGYCSNGSYTDESSCVGAGYYSGGYCSGGGYYDQSSCESAGYYSSGYCSNGSYYDEYSCTSAGHTEGYGCSNGGYYDRSSCEGAGYSMGGAYCSDGWSSDEYSCNQNGGYWYPEQWYSYGYTWSDGYWASDNNTWYPGQSYGYGYTWYPGYWMSEGNTWYAGGWQSANNYWSEPTWYSYGYTWYGGSGWQSYNYTWADGSYTLNTWTSVPGGVWGSY